MKKFYPMLFMLAAAFYTHTVTAQTVFHYWNFNNAANVTELLTPTASLVGSPSVTHVAGSFSELTSGTGQDFTTLNAQNGDPAGSHLRFNNPIGGGIVFALPTTGYTNVMVKYATRRSGSGATTQSIEYSINGTDFISFTTFAPVSAAPTLATLDFSSIAAVNDNPNFKIRITFSGGTAGADTGNNRFDNFTVDGNSLGAGDTTPPTVVILPANSSVSVPLNTVPTLTFNEDVRLVDNSTLDNTNVDAVIDFRLNNSTGTTVPFDATISGKVITVTPASSLVNGQAYYLGVKAGMVEDMSDNMLVGSPSSTFTTIAPQTDFNAGDIVFVACRTNASTPDEVAFLTFVDILPGTQINLTDAKYTDNAQRQCAGGFIWTAPASGVKAGSVVTISVDSPFNTSIGTVTGSSFGLSSGGDQVIMYTGTAASPEYITAMSTNAWLTANTTCNGSNSKLPAGLADGQTSINLSTAPGNVSANTVNAYYNGTQMGTIAQLRAAILNPANWLGTGSGTPAQTWPVWSFGAPYVATASVTSQTTLTLIFNKPLDATSAALVANYTGIAGLQSAVLGSDSKTVTLTYSTPFTPSAAYALTVTGIKDDQNVVMAAPYTFNFTYSTILSFEKKYDSVQESAGTLVVKLKLQFPSVSSIDLVVKGSTFSTAGSEDFTLATQTLNFTGTTELEQLITIPIIDDAIGEQDEYFVLSLENANGISVTGGTYMTIYIKDNDRVAPVPNKEIELTHVSSYNPGSSTAEIVMHDPETQKLFIISSVQNRLDVADFSNPAEIKDLPSIDMTPYGGITSVAIKNGIVAVSSPNTDAMANGSVVFFTTEGQFIKQLTVGVLPDMITFSHDGTKVLTANEGQPNDAYTVDPEGSVSIIDISGGVESLEQADVTTLLFTDFNSQETALIAAGVRKLKQSSTLSQDFEPEYITVSADSKKAWVTIQENNAIGEINLETKTITSIWPLGKKDLSVFGNGIDASDNSGIITIANWPVKAFYLPDAIASYTVSGTQYLVTANEGDEKEYAGLTERTTVGAVTLDPVIFPNAAVLKESHNLGRLRMSNLSGDTDGDGDYDEINIPGGRSFTIWNATTKTKVYDSGDDFERYTATDPSTAAIFNADNEGNGFKSRSRAKGPEPEGLTLASINHKTYAFIALERVGGIMVYDVTDPTNVKFVDYKNSRSTISYEGDHGPEGIIYIAPENSPDGNGYIAVANEISGTVSVFEITPTPKQEQAIVFSEIPNKTMGDAAFSLTASASSELPVSFAADGNEVTINANQVTLAQAGKVTVTATQAGNTVYFEAPPVSHTFCVNPAKPVITLVEGNGDPVLQSSATASNQWYKDGELLAGATNRTFTASSVGSYTVIATVETCASVVSEPYMIVITGVEQPNAESFSVYPNPATNQVSIKLPGTGNKTVTIYQATGMVKQSFTTTQQEAELDLSHYAAGYYTISVKTSTGILYKKLIRK